ncbi:hypothetical protein [Aestuariibacter salexigens]|uniref:hypothetical protein n=1 Tax=Aestuariibacter salexigens TaxID=226010 RepID=UPI00146FB222|nr:hypothetical protein [Aestuariibacter salexigens]
MRFLWQLLHISCQSSTALPRTRYRMLAVDEHAAHWRGGLVLLRLPISALVRVALPERQQSLNPILQDPPIIALPW